MEQFTSRARAKFLTDLSRGRHLSDIRKGQYRSQLRVGQQMATKINIKWNQSGGGKREAVTIEMPRTGATHQRRTISKELPKARPLHLSQCACRLKLQLAAPVHSGAALLLDRTPSTRLEIP
jgi:hypothetical protein